MQVTSAIERRELTLMKKKKKQKNKEDKKRRREKIRHLQIKNSLRMPKVTYLILARSLVSYKITPFSMVISLLLTL